MNYNIHDDLDCHFDESGGEHLQEDADDFSHVFGESLFVDPEIIQQEALYQAIIKVLAASDDAGARRHLYNLQNQLDEVNTSISGYTLFWFAGNSFPLVLSESTSSKALELAEIQGDSVVIKDLVQYRNRRFGVPYPKRYRDFKYEPHCHRSVHDIKWLKQFFIVRELLFQPNSRPFFPEKTPISYVPTYRQLHNFIRVQKIIFCRKNDGFHPKRRLLLESLNGWSWEPRCLACNCALSVELDKRKPATIGSRIWETRHYCGVCKPYYKKTYFCSFNGCGKAFKDCGDRLKHERTHRNERPYACDVEGCGRRFKTNGHLMKHARVHTDKRPFECDVEGCGKRFKTNRELKQHAKVHTDKRPFLCGEEGCGRRFKTNGHLMKHARVHTDERPFVCGVEGCGKPFKRTGDLKRHATRVHTDERPFACGVEGCGKPFKTELELQRHAIVHTGEHPLACDVEGCGRRFKRKGELTQHALVHTDKRPFVCGEEGCGRRFKIRSKLTQHIKKVHTDERPFICNVCGRRFKTNWSLKSHYSRVHTDDRPFPCDVKGCGQRFKANADLKSHYSRVHTDEKPVVCDVKGCGQRFKMNADLKSHLSVHTDERPFVCGVQGCRQLFKRNSDLKRHTSTVHNNDRPRKKRRILM